MRGFSGPLALLAVAVLVAWNVHDRLTLSGRTAYHLTGWIAFGLIVATWVLASRDTAAPAVGPSRLVWAAVLLGGAVLVHTGLRGPDGWLEIGLCVLVLASCVVGFAMDGRQPRRVATRQGIQVPLLAGVLGAALIHGVLCHAHGYLAALTGATP